jgi:hypothetical protein
MERGDRWASSSVSSAKGSVARETSAMGVPGREMHQTYGRGRARWARGRGRGQRGGTRLHTLAGRRGCHELADWVWAARVWGDGGEQVKKNGFHSEHWLPAKKEYGIQSRCRGGGGTLEGSGS